jgi:chromosome segregation ATPase
MELNENNEPRISETERENHAAEHRGAESRPRGMGTAAIVAIAVLAVMNAYLLWGMQELKSSVANLEERYTSEVAVMQESASLEAGKRQRELEELRGQLDAAQKEAETAVGNAKVEAKKHAERLAGKLAAEQKKEAELLATELTAVREQTDTKFEEVSSNVGEVRDEVASTREELTSAVGHLTQVRGDLGIVSGRIATNADELAALRALGDRNYTEFDVVKTNKPVRVADIQLQLKKTDRKRNKFTMEVFADDKRIEKKDKTVNEPIQFYVGGRGSQPYELVINKVSKDRIAGYLSTPKTIRASR